ncbi:MAG: hypothetical protein GF344_12410, partial [Chitinivibrionales bacterium]|nr:hypothetical protein [Chitinivibrionales bacterium]
VFPNPATLRALRYNSSYRVRFTSTGEYSRIAIYSISGQRIRNLSTKQSPSTHADYWEWDGRNENGTMVEPGTYFFHALKHRKEGTIGKILLKP